jgi:hypothetical protein
MKRRRTGAKFIADLGRELPKRHTALASHPWKCPTGPSTTARKIYPACALGLYREVLHEKLSDGQLHWADNDLVDMMYLATATGYRDYVVGERTHTAHLANALRRLGRTDNTHRHLRSLVKQL